jgi:CRISPR/Cas system-associated endoribonuclease Cas2
LDKALFDKLMETVDTILKPDEDFLSVYPLCAACAKKVVRLGKAGLREIVGEEKVFIV